MRGFFILKMDGRRRNRKCVSVEYDQICCFIPSSRREKQTMREREKNTSCWWIWFIFFWALQWWWCLIELFEADITGIFTEALTADHQAILKKIEIEEETELCREDLPCEWFHDHLNRHGIDGCQDRIYAGVNERLMNDPWWDNWSNAI